MTQLQSIGSHPQRDVINTLRQTTLLLGCCIRFAETVYLRVVGVFIIVDHGFLSVIVHRVQKKQDRTKNRSLWHPTLDTLNS